MTTSERRVPTGSMLGSPHTECPLWRCYASADRRFCAGRCGAIWVSGRGLSGEDRHGAWYAFEFVVAAVLVGDAGSGGEVDDRACYQDLAGSSECRDAIRD